MTDQGPPAEKRLPEEELERLRAENRKLARQLKSLQGILDRGKIANQVKASYAAVLNAEKNRLDKHMALLLENCPDIILLFDESERFAFCTAAFLRHTGIGGSGLIDGQPFDKVLARFAEGEALQRINAAYAAAMAESRPAELKEVIDISRSGNPRSYDISITPMLDDLGKSMGAMILLHDMTDVNRAREDAERANRAKSSFLSNMSHEMRTPMNAVIGMTSIARSAPDIEKKDYCLGKIEEASTHLLGVINDILDMSKIEANKFELSCTEFNFERMIMRVNNVVNFRIEERAQHFVLQIDKNIPRTIIADEQRLSQVLTNLLSNAVKFTPEGGTISLSAKTIEDRDGLCTLRIDVADTGIGISEEAQSRLFQSFSQADNGIARKFGGTGLGLAISKRIVEMMDGEVTLKSIPGEGATFTVTVRVRRGTRQREPDREQVDWKSIRVLVVDDEPAVLEYFESVAESVGFSCVTAPDGESACRILEKNLDAPFPLIFVDWKMPGMNGVELTGEIKRRYGDRTVVIMISANEWSVIEDEAKLAGVDSFISKPLFTSLIVDCIVENVQEAASIRPKAQESAPDDEGSLAGFRILLAEDIEINREIARALLEPTGLTIDCAENGVEACRLVLGSDPPYDLVLMDIHMPEMDGYEATRRIRAEEAAKGGEPVPIIAMTANVFKEDVERCLSVGMNDHLGKPLNMDDVIGKLKFYLLRQSDLKAGEQK